ncbi:MAG: hypothetical protein HQK53_17985 [Oligoflexia bacterium]|nr:hypothetical protein [Oligoflexia bacterium]
MASDIIFKVKAAAVANLGRLGASRKRRRTGAGSVQKAARTHGTVSSLTEEKIFETVVLMIMEKF